MLLKKSIELIFWCFGGDPLPALCADMLFDAFALHFIYLVHIHIIPPQASQVME